MVVKVAVLVLVDGGKYRRLNSTSNPPGPFGPGNWSSDTNRTLRPPDSLERFARLLLCRFGSNRKVSSDAVPGVATLTPPALANPVSS